MLYSSYPQTVDLDSSPFSDTLAYNEQPDKTYSGDASTNLPDYSLSGFFDPDPNLGDSSTSIDMTYANFPTIRPYNPTLPATGISAADEQQAFPPAFYQQSFEEMQQYQSGYALDPTSISAAEPEPFSPTSQPSRTPSLCGDGQFQEVPVSPWLSTPPIKRESSFPASVEEETTSKRPQRKRGRPRIERENTSLQSSASSSTKGQRASRLPHNQVERKYREGLNAELEKLRKAVPTLPQSEDAGGMGQPKPSKAMVLAGAIDYIKRIEKERDTLLGEIERLKQIQ
ncbi:hypothetical protein FB567DRAFT_419122, partial [Paraphoma chrysanthemicola]